MNTWRWQFFVFLKNIFKKCDTCDTWPFYPYTIRILAYHILYHIWKNVSHLWYEMWYSPQNVSHFRKNVIHTVSHLKYPQTRMYTEFFPSFHSLRITFVSLFQTKCDTHKYTKTMNIYTYCRTRQIFYNIIDTRATVKKENYLWKTVPLRASTTFVRTNPVKRTSRTLLWRNAKTAASTVPEKQQNGTKPFVTNDRKTKIVTTTGSSHSKNGASFSSSLSSYTGKKSNTSYTFLQQKIRVTTWLNVKIKL